MAIRRQLAGSYLVALPHDNPRLRACLLRVVQSLLVKGLPVCVLELSNIIATRVTICHESSGLGRQCPGGGVCVASKRQEARVRSPRFLSLPKPLDKRTRIY